MPFGDFFAPKAPINLRSGSHSKLYGNEYFVFQFICDFGESALRTEVMEMEMGVEMGMGMEMGVEMGMGMEMGMEMGVGMETVIVMVIANRT